MKRQSGFTLIELVIVVVILGFLAVTAIPKFLDLTDQAKQANIEGMAGGFATGVSLARAQWAAEGRPVTANSNSTSYDGTVLFLTTGTTDNTFREGYAVGLTALADDVADMTLGRCQDVWNGILSQPPTTATTLALLNDAATTGDYLIRVNAGVGSDSNDICAYYLKETLDKNGSGDYIAPSDATVGNYFTYDPSNSSVVVTIND